jgi:hypothetical protein
MDETQTEPLTDELLDELLAAPNLDSYLGERQPGRRTLSDYLKHLLDKKGLVQSKVLAETEIGYTYGYEIISGRKEHPARDRVLQLVFAMQMDLKESARTLQAAGLSPLSPKNERDAIIIFCVNKGMSMMECNDELVKRGHKALYDPD